MLELIWDALTDTVKLLPFLFLTYLAMEYLEHRLKDQTRELLRRAGRLGPLWGGLLGAAPQCGFSAAAASLYAGRVISIGTLFAVFLSTSDEMLPMLISRQAPAGGILAILGLKAGIGVVIGFLLDQVFGRPGGKNAIHALCDEGRCGCRSHGILRAALDHTLKIGLFLLLVNLLLGAVITMTGQAALRRLFAAHPAMAVFLSALVGLIPNCGSSVAITTLYLDGVLRFGAMMAGLLVGAGVGLLVLFRVNRRPWENALITVILYGVGVGCGVLLDLLVK